MTCWRELLFSCSSLCPPHHLFYTPINASFFLYHRSLIVSSSSHMAWLFFAIKVKIHFHRSKQFLFRPAKPYVCVAFYWNQHLSKSPINLKQRGNRVKTFQSSAKSLFVTNDVTLKESRLFLHAIVVL